MKKFRNYSVACVLFACLASTSANAGLVLDLSTAGVAEESFTFNNRRGVRAFDGLLTGENWESTSSLGDPQWVYVDLGGAFDITQIRIAHGTPLNHAVAYDLYVSEGLTAPDPETVLIKQPLFCKYRDEQAGHLAFMFR